MPTKLTDTQAKLLHTQCPVCQESELTILDAIEPDALLLYCPNCQTTIDGAGVVERNIIMENIYNPAICSSSLDEYGYPFTGETAHRWDDTENPITCAECGTTKDKDTQPQD